jgi:hypothetical protein
VKLLPLILSEGHTLEVTEIKVLLGTKRGAVTGGWIKLHEAGHVARIGKYEEFIRHFSGKFKGRDHLGYLGVDWR